MILATQYASGELGCQPKIPPLIILSIYNKNLICVKSSEKPCIRYVRLQRAVAVHVRMCLWSCLVKLKILKSSWFVAVSQLLASTLFSGFYYYSFLKSGPKTVLFEELLILGEAAEIPQNRAYAWTAPSSPASICDWQLSA